MDKKCEVCGKEFSTYINKKRFCSRDCQLKAKRNKRLKSRGIETYYNIKDTYKLGKEGEKIVAELFKEMGFKVRFVGVEHRSHYKDIKSRDIFSPDLKIYDEYNDHYLYMEIKTIINIYNNEFYIPKKLFDNYNKFYPDNSFLVLYLPTKNRIGMRAISDLIRIKLDRYVKDLAYKKNGKLIKEKALLLPFKFFRNLQFYSREIPYSFKFNYDQDKIIDFLKQRQDKIIKLTEVENI